MREAQIQVAISCFEDGVVDQSSRGVVFSAVDEIIGITGAPYIDGELAGASSKACPQEKQRGSFAPWAARTCWTARMVWTARMGIVDPERRSERSLQPHIYSWVAGMENETCSKHVFTICARRLRLGEFLL